MGNYPLSSPSCHRLHCSLKLESLETTVLGPFIVLPEWSVPWRRSESLGLHHTSHIWGWSQFTSDPGWAISNYGQTILYCYYFKYYTSVKCVSGLYPRLQEPLHCDSRFSFSRAKCLLPFHLSHIWATGISGIQPGSCAQNKIWILGWSSSGNLVYLLFAGVRIRGFLLLKDPWQLRNFAASFQGFRVGKFQDGYK